MLINEKYEKILTEIRTIFFQIDRGALPSLFPWHLEHIFFNHCFNIVVKLFIHKYNWDLEF